MPKNMCKMCKHTFWKEFNKEIRIIQRYNSNSWWKLKQSPRVSQRAATFKIFENSQEYVCDRVFIVTLQTHVLQFSQKKCSYKGDSQNGVLCKTWAKKPRLYYLSRSYRSWTGWFVSTNSITFDQESECFSCLCRFEIGKNNHRHLSRWLHTCNEAEIFQQKEINKTAGPQLQHKCFHVNLQCSLLPFSRYCCSKVVGVITRPAGCKKRKGAKMFDFCWSCLKSEWSISLAGFDFFHYYGDPFSMGKIEKLDFWDPNNSTNFKHQ